MKTLRYMPHLNATTGSINATLLLLQLEYWFEITHLKPFFKFLSPCEHERYQVEDSWVEELGFTKAEFRYAFSQIGTVYKSKTAYLNSTDPFKGKLYLSYFDRIKKLTFYVRNHEAVDKLLATSSSKENSPSTNTESVCGISLDYSNKLLSLEETKKTKSPSTTPYEKIVEAFHTYCPHLSSVTTLTNKRKKMLDQL